MKKRLFIGAVLCEMLLLPAAQGLADVAVVMQAKSTVTLTEEQIGKIFLGKMRNLPNGEPVKPVDQREGSKPRQEFLSKVLHKTEPALKSHWSNLVFTGNGVPPDALSDDAAVKAFVVQNPNGIGYIDSESVDASVRVLMNIK